MGRALAMSFCLWFALTLFSISLQSWQAKGSESTFPYYPDVWEIHYDIGSEIFEPYDDKRKSNLSLRKTIETNKSCFGDGEGNYSIAPFTSMKISKMPEKIRDQFSDVLDNYLSKYCKSKKCKVNEREKKYLCTEEDSKEFAAGGNAMYEVLTLLKYYLEYQTAKYKLVGGKKHSRKNGESCVEPPFKLRLDEKPREVAQKTLDEAASKDRYLGRFCESRNCTYDFPSKTFLCRSGSFQAMAAPISLLLVTSGILNRFS